MTKLLDTAVAKLRKLPRERQDEAAELLLSLLDQEPDEMQLTRQQIAVIERRLREPGELIDHADVRAYVQTRTK